MNQGDAAASMCRMVVCEGERQRGTASTRRAAAASWAGRGRHMCRAGQEAARHGAMQAARTRERIRSSMSAPESIGVRELLPDRMWKPAHVYTKDSDEGNGRGVVQRDPSKEHGCVCVNMAVSTRPLIAQRSAVSTAAFPVRTAAPPDGFSPVLYDVRACLGTLGSPGRRGPLHPALQMCWIA